MRLKKNFAFGKGKYYFTIKSSPNNITIYRKTKKAAKDAYVNYLKLGKECEWLGQWDGKRFVEDTAPVAA